MRWMIEATLAPDVTRMHWVQTAVNDLKADAATLHGDIRQLDGAVHAGARVPGQLPRRAYGEREPDPENPAMNLRDMLFALAVVVIVVILLVSRVHEMIF